MPVLTDADAAADVADEPHPDNSTDDAQAQTQTAPIASDSTAGDVQTSDSTGTGA